MSDEKDISEIIKELKELKDLLDAGAITRDEFDKLGGRTITDFVLKEKAEEAARIEAEKKKTEEAKREAERKVEEARLKEEHKEKLRQQEEARNFKREKRKTQTRKAAKICVPILCCLVLVCSFVIYTNITRIGDIVTFGSYEQDNDASNGKEPIEWRVLDKKDGKALVISKYVLDSKPYNEEWVETTWETSDLRQWLNSIFLNKAFTTSEQEKICLTTVTADANPYYRTDPGNDTEDKVFLLDTGEAETYFESTETSYEDNDGKTWPKFEDRMCGATDYAAANNSLAISTCNLLADDKISCCWLLRTPGEYSNNITYATTGGRIVYDGASVDCGAEGSDYTSAGIRPAMWIEL